MFMTHAVYNINSVAYYVRELYADASLSFVLTDVVYFSKIAIVSTI